MLTRSERNEVQEALAVVLMDSGNPKSLIRLIFGQEATPILRFATGILPDEIADLTVNACLKSRWELNPSLLEMLLDDLVNRRGAAAFKDVLKRVKEHVDPNPSLYEETWLAGRHPFIDRREFREHLQSLVDDDTRPVLRVSSAAGSFGHTYSLIFLRHLKSRLPRTVKMISVELSEGTGPLYQVSDLLDEIRSQLGVNEAIPPRTTSAYHIEAARWMLRHLMADPGQSQWWLVLDGFGQAGLNPEVGETIGALAGLVPRGAYPDRVRLILLDYPRPLPDYIGDSVLEENLPPAAAIVPNDLKPCLRAWDAERARQGKRQLAAEEQDLAKLAAGIVGQLPPTGKQRLVVLNKKLKELHKFPF